MEKINVNKASATDLQKIIGVGKKRAELIIKNRPFLDIYELSKVAGLGAKRMERILQQDLIIVL
jgi:competence ComEA-like helix-hairpin-helix protein